MSQTLDVAALAAAYADKSPQEVLKLAFEHFGDDLWISFSGAEDVVLVDMAWKLNRPFSRTSGSSRRGSGDSTSIWMP
jgi:phosphoadenosine phosphosulfate reductase